jgi:MoxR-like ATPase
VTRASCATARAPAARRPLLAAKVAALADGRFSVGVDDVRRAVKPALRHRMILGFEGEAEGVRPDALLDEVLAAIPDVTGAKGAKGATPSS